MTCRITILNLRVSVELQYKRIVNASGYEVRLGIPKLYILLTPNLIIFMFQSNLGGGQIPY